MPPTPYIVALVLLAAFLHALWNAVVKSGGDRLLALGSVNAVGAVVAVCIIPFTTLPGADSWFFLLLSVVIHLGYYVFLLQAYRVGDLSHVYPLARGVAPVLVLLGAALFADELLPGLAIIGVLLASTGIISLAFERGLPWRHDHRPLGFALATGLCIAAYTVVDGMGVRVSGSPLGYIGWLFFIDGLLFSAYVYYRRRARVLPFLRSEWKAYLGGGLAAMLAYGLVIYAMNFTAMGTVSALRETSVIMAVLIGTFVLGEKFGGRRMIAAAIVVAGVGLMHWGHYGSAPTSRTVAQSSMTSESLWGPSHVRQPTRRALQQPLNRGLRLASGGDGR